MSDVDSGDLIAGFPSLVQPSAPAPSPEANTARLAEIEGFMRAGRGTTEGAKYWKDPQVQTEYRNLLETSTKPAASSFPAGAVSRGAAVGNAEPAAESGRVDSAAGDAPNQGRVTDEQFAKAEQLVAPIFDTFRADMQRINAPPQAVDAALDFVKRRMRGDGDVANAQRQHGYRMQSAQDFGLSDRDTPAVHAFLNRMDKIGMPEADAFVLVSWYSDHLKRNGGGFLPLKRK